MPSPSSTADYDAAALQDRARRRRQRFAASAVAATVHPWIRTRISVRDVLRSLPVRLAHHLLVGVIVSLAALVSSRELGLGVWSTVPIPSIPATDHPSADVIVPLAPLSLDDSTDDAPVPDSAFAAIDALPAPPVDPSLLQRPVPATVTAERAALRTGPGTEYDKLQALPAGALLTLVARHDDWYQARTADGALVWVAAELLDLDPAAADFLPEPASIPTPPPPKVGLVAEAGLNLRDGPGTTYMGVTALDAGAPLALLARYEDWFQVQAPDGQVGWVTSRFLTLAPGVAERVEAVAEIPDPTPDLVAVVSEASANLRGGPGTGYAKLSTLGADAQLALLARSKDWFKVRTAQGAEGWVSSELVEVSAYVERRVPVARTIPPLPKAARPAQTGGIRGPVQFAPASATSGPVQFALQFTGARYVWGAASPSVGFDCSGFTQYVYAQYGVSLPHSSAGQYSTRYGAAISNPADLQPGDLVFFVNTYKRGISHVGIYIGGGDVVQALSPGRGVGIASLQDSYWASRYYGGIRPTR